MVTVDRIDGMMVLMRRIGNTEVETSRNPKVPVTVTERKKNEEKSIGQKKMYDEELLFLHL